MIKDIIKNAEEKMKKNNICIRVRFINNESW